MNEAGEGKETEGLKAVGFKSGVGELRTEEVALEGYVPFTITFEVPGLSGIVDLAAANKDGSLPGDAVARFSAKYLKTWSLGGASTREALEALEELEVFFAIFNTIRKARDDAKN